MRLKNVASRTAIVLSAVATFIVSAGFDEGGCGGPPPIRACSADSDCNDGFYCAMPVNTTDLKDSDRTAPSLCGGGQAGGLRPRCAAPPQEKPLGRCLRRPTGCHSDSDCAEGFYCSRSGEKQVPLPDGPAPSTRCGGSQSGGIRTRCADMTPPEPPPAGRCLRRPPEPSGCLVDSDCRSGQVCSRPQTTSAAKREGGSPIAPCLDHDRCRPPRGVCIDKPQPRRCSSNNDCGLGERCLLGKSSPSGSGDREEDARQSPSRVGCGGGVSDAGPSDAGPAPRPGCIPPPPPPTGVCVKAQSRCSKDSDCGRGRRCVIRCGTPPIAPDSGICQDIITCSKLGLNGKVCEVCKNAAGKVVSTNCSSCEGRPSCSEREEGGARCWVCNDGCGNITRSCSTTPAPDAGTEDQP